MLTLEKWVCTGSLHSKAVPNYLVSTFLDSLICYFVVMTVAVCYCVTIISNVDFLNSFIPSFLV